MRPAIPPHTRRGARDDAGRTAVVLVDRAEAGAPGGLEAGRPGEGADGAVEYRGRGSEPGDRSA